MASRPHIILPHGDLEELAPGLWTVQGNLPIPLLRKMTVYRLRDGSLLLHSVIALGDEGMARLAALGRPSAMIVPNTGHRMDAPFYKARFPELRVLCPAAARAKVEEVIKVDATCEETLPALGVQVHGIDGCKSGELVYEVQIDGGSALLFCDIVGNNLYAPGFLGRLISRITGGVKGRLGVARIVRMFLLKDKAATRASLERLAALPDVRLLLPTHGHPVRQDCAGALREAAAGL